jgi:hypothetical protein
MALDVRGTRAHICSSYIGSAKDQERPLLRGKPYALIILVLGASQCDTALITPLSSGWTSGMIL